MSHDVKYIGMDVHKEAIVIAVLNGSGKLVMEIILETKASSILQFLHGLKGELHVTWEEGTWAAWLYDLLQPQVQEVVVCNPRRNALLKEGSKSDKVDAPKLSFPYFDNRQKWSLSSAFHLHHRFACLEGLPAFTGRKIIVDTYGGAARHGGGAFSGKDPSKVDRSAAYFCRYVARQVVLQGLASRVEIQVAYAIGVANVRNRRGGRNEKR